MCKVPKRKEKLKKAMQKDSEQRGLAAGLLRITRVFNQMTNYKADNKGENYGQWPSARTESEDPEATGQG